MALVCSAPGRVNLIGEHTDYNGGPVLPCAILRRTWVAAGPGDGWVVASAIDGSTHMIDPDARAHGAWTDYVTAAIRVLRRERLAPGGARLTIATSIPIGAGLASSAALTVGVTAALAGLTGRRLAPAVLADVAYRAEHDEVGVRCGRMDQTVAAFARSGAALWFEAGTGEIRHLPFAGRIWIFETGTSHQLAEGQLNIRRGECEEALRLLADAGIPLRHLAELAPADLARAERALPPPWRDRVRHVVSETARTREAAAALGRRDLERFGALLFQSHVSMRDAYQASCRTADILVEAASRHGAYGARLTGAGWGGAVIALLPESRATPIAIAMSEDFERATGRAPVVWWTRAGGGVRRVLSAE